MNKNTKRNLTTGVLALSLAASLAQAPYTDAASCKINRKKITLSKGKCYKLKVKGVSGTVTWKTSDKKIATVSKKGKVTAKRTGTAKITAKVKSKKLTCKVTVKKRINGNGTTVQKPASASPTVTTQAPVTTQKPGTSQKPAGTQKPGSIQKPASAQKPSISLTPTGTQKPVTTQKPSSSQTTVPSGTVTEESAYATLNSLRGTYPEKMPLDNSYYYYSPRFGNGYGCYGFAAKLSDTVFGTEKAYQTHTSFDKIKVGDNIRIGNSHSVIVLTKEASYITVVEGNYNSSVHWDRKITSSSLASSGFKVYTRY